MADDTAMADDKAMADVRRVRHAPDAKRHGIHGKTAHRLHSSWCTLPLRAELTRAHHQDSRQSIVHTALELGGREASHSLDRDLAWEHVPSLLAENAVSPPLVNKKSDGTVETTYLLEPLVEEVRSKEEDADEKWRRPCTTDGKIYRLHNGKRPILFAVPPTEAPESAGKLLVPVRIGDCRNSRSFPLVRRPGGASWDVTRAGGVGIAQLDVDLGADCHLSHVSTQGRPPPTRVYPTVRRERRRLRADLLGTRYQRMADLGRRAQRTALAQRREAEAEDEAVGDYYYVEGRRWDLLRHGQYPGPYWDVLDLRGDQERCQRTGRAYAPGERWLQWVSRYEILYRVDGGRQWHSLGVFKGNNDATTEACHDVRGLRARYLRFVPLEVEGMGALRVGVYGLTCAAAARGTGCSAAGGEEAPDPISYTLRQCGEGLNTTYSYCERLTWTGPRDRYRFQRQSRKAMESLRASIEEGRRGAVEPEGEWWEGEFESAPTGWHAPERPRVSAWVDEQMQRRQQRLSASALDGDNVWSEAKSEEWSEAAWSELSEAEQWLQIEAFGFAADEDDHDG